MRTDKPPSNNDIKRFVKNVLKSYRSANLDEVTPKRVFDDVIERCVGFNLDHKKYFIKTIINRFLGGEPSPRQLLRLVIILENKPELSGERNFDDHGSYLEWKAVAKKLNSVRGQQRCQNYWEAYWYHKQAELEHIIADRINALQNPSSNGVHLVRQSELTERMIAVVESLSPSLPTRSQLYDLDDILQSNPDLADELYVIGGDLNEKWFDAARKLNATRGGIIRSPQFWARYWAKKKLALTLVIERRIKTGKPLYKSAMDEHLIMLLERLRKKRLEKETRRNERLERCRHERDPSPGSSSFLSGDPSPEQLLELVTFLEGNPDVADEIYASSEDIIEKWEDISNELNSVKGGVKGSPQLWARYWSTKKLDLNLILDERILAAEIGSHSKDLPPQQPLLMERLITLLKRLRDQRKEKRKKKKWDRLRNQRLEREGRSNKKDPSPEPSSWTLGDPNTGQLWKLVVFLEGNPDVAVDVTPDMHWKWEVISNELNLVRGGIKGDWNFWFKYWSQKQKYLNRVIDKRIRISTEQTSSHSRVQLPSQPMLIERMIKFLLKLRIQSEPSSPEPSSRPDMRDFSQQTDPICGTLRDTLTRLHACGFCPTRNVAWKF